MIGMKVDSNRMVHIIIIKMASFYIRVLEG